jgi:hypothetical protein
LEIAAAVAAALATNIGLRTGSFNTLMNSFTRWVTTAVAEQMANGSGKSVSPVQ